MPPIAHNVCRPAEPGDLDQVAQIWLDGWRSNAISLPVEPNYAGLRRRIEAEIADGWQVIVADVAGQIAGFVARSTAANVLEQIFVAPAFHRRGIGRALLAHARTAMPGGFRLWTHAENARASAFYVAQGLALVGPGTHPRHGHPILTYADGAMAA